jgi:hypothetical protein
MSHVFGECWFENKSEQADDVLVAVAKIAFRQLMSEEGRRVTRVS